jgi:hypothetical protein
MDVLRFMSSAFNLPFNHFCLYSTIIVISLLILRTFKSSSHKVPSKAALLRHIAASSAVYGRASAMLQPTSDHRQMLRATDPWHKVEKVERDLGHTQSQPQSPASSPDFMLPSKIVTRHLHVALTSDSDAFNLYTVQHNLLVGCIQWLSAPAQASHIDVAKRAAEVLLLNITSVFV